MRILKLLFYGIFFKFSEYDNNGNRKILTRKEYINRLSEREKSIKRHGDYINDLKFEKDDNLGCYVSTNTKSGSIWYRLDSKFAYINHVDLNNNNYYVVINEEMFSMGDDSREIAEKVAVDYVVHGSVPIMLENKHIN